MSEFEIKRELREQIRNIKKMQEGKGIEEQEVIGSIQGTEQRNAILNGTNGNIELSDKIEKSMKTVQKVNEANMSFMEKYKVEGINASIDVGKYEDERGQKADERESSCEER